MKQDAILDAVIIEVRRGVESKEIRTKLRGCLCNPVYCTEDECMCSLPYECSICSVLLYFEGLMDMLEYTESMREEVMIC